MTFLLNPYDADLDLSDKEDRKLFTEGCKGVSEKDIFDGRKQNYSNFVKLIEGNLNSKRTMSALKISTKWEAGSGADAAKRTPLSEGDIDLFKSNEVKKEELEEYVALVWSDSDFGGNTPKYFREFGTAPIDTASLNKLRNIQKLKHVMLGHQLWNSISSAFKVEIIGSKKEFSRGQEYDGVLLWDFIRRRINPTTTVGASKLKDEIESHTPAMFDNDIIKYNTWFEDTRTAIIKEEGKGYNEYLRSLFRAYLTCAPGDFLDAIKDEKRKWIQGKVARNYSYSDLLSLGRITFNNLADEEDCKNEFVLKPENKEEEKNYLALATALMTKMSSMSNGSSGGNSGGSSGIDERKGSRTYQAWRYENPDNAATKEVRGSIMKWCKNDCHDKPMWCGRKNCLGRADYSAAWKKRNAGKSNSEKPSSEFKIALAAMTSPEDFAALQEQFKELKD